MQLDWLDGQMTDQCGQDHRPVSRSRSQESGKGQMTSDTCGPSGSILSESANLQSYLESKLLPLSDKDGLIPFKKTWKLQVSALSTKGIGSGSWPTPSATDHKGGYQGGRIRNGKWSSDRLDQAVQLTGWPTPIASDNRSRGSYESQAVKNRIKNGQTIALSMMVASIWLTPTTSDTNGVRRPDGKRSGGLNTQAAQVSGMESKPSSAKTEKSAPSQLNPRFSLWLMGYPIGWSHCAERVTPLSRKSRQK